MAIIERIQDPWKDSVLTRQDASSERNMDLLFEVRVWFDFRNSFSPEAERQARRIHTPPHTPTPWTNAAKQHFKTSYFNRIHAFWSRRLWFIPDRDWAGLSMVTPNPTRELVQIYVPNIRCRVRLSEASSENAHLILEVYHFADSSGARFRGMGAATGGIVNEQSPPSRIWCCSQNVDEVWGSTQSPIANPSQPPALPAGSDVPTNNHDRKFVSAIHEFGHFLGLDHVRHRVASGSEYGNEGRVQTYDSWNVLGRGRRLDEWNAFPWAKRLSRHLTIQGQTLAVGDWHSQTGGNVTFRTYDGRTTTAEADRVTWSVSLQSRPPSIRTERGR